MALPYYVSPEQFIRDKSDYARKMIARGKPVVALEYANGILFVTENPSVTLHKISEIYDRLAFAGLGKFNEFETLRMHGIRQADLRGYAYSREDVSARGLANSYSQILGQIFSEQLKPFEVEILIAGVGADADSNELYHILYDGSVSAQKEFVAMGGPAEELRDHVREHYRAGLGAAEALRLGVEALNSVQEDEIGADNLEAAVLDRTRERRKFHRFDDAETRELLG